MRGQLLDVVGCVIPIAIEIPLVLNIARSFCMSPMVATAPVETPRRLAIACTNVPLSSRVA